MLGTIGSNYAVARQSYHWLMTNHALVKKGVRVDSDGTADCSCSELETQWHVMGMGSCNSYPTIRKRFSRMRDEMMEQVGIPAGVQEAIRANHEPNQEGVYPDWADPAYVFKFREMKIVNLFENHRNAAIHWFQNGHPMKTWITDCEELLGVNEKQAEKFSKEWYNIKRQETAALWAQRQNIFKTDVISMSQLRDQLAEALKAKRARKSKTRSNERYLKMSRKQIENFLEQEKRIVLGGSIIRFAVDPGASDEKKAKVKQEKLIAKLDRDEKRKEKKRKTQQKVKAKRKITVTDTLVHIDEMMHHESGPSPNAGSGSVARRKERHKRRRKVAKAKVKAANQKIKECRQVKDRKWEMGGKRSMAIWLKTAGSDSRGSASSHNSRNWSSTQWINELISKRGNRKENPDRDKAGS